MFSKIIKFRPAEILFHPLGQGLIVFSASGRIFSSFFIVDIILVIVLLGWVVEIAIDVGFVFGVVVIWYFNSSNNGDGAEEPFVFIFTLALFIDSNNSIISSLSISSIDFFILYNF